MNKLEESIKELKNYLYFNKIEQSDIDKTNIQKSLFKLIRECIKNNTHIVEVGSYILNINPDELSVKYETENTLIEVSNNDVHLENTKETDVEYFVISKDDKNEYLITTPAIRVTGAISTYDDQYEEIYEISISEDIDDDIKKYINLKDKFSYSENEFTNKYTAIVKRPINKQTPYISPYELLDKSIVRPVLYNNQYDIYIKREINNNKSYIDLIPKLNDKKIITSYLYSLIVEFYTDYMNNNS